MLCCVPESARIYFWSVFVCACLDLCICLYFSCLCVCVHEYMWMREWDKKEMKSCSEKLSHSEASPSVRLGLIVAGCKDMGKGRKATLLVPCPRVISVTLKEHHQHAPDYCHVNNGTWLDSPLMNVIYFSKRGLIIDWGPLSPPTGSTSQLAAKRWLLIFVFFKFVYMYVCVHMLLWHGE